jgi:opacity protein-like surface antigen
MGRPLFRENLFTPVPQVAEIKNKKMKTLKGKIIMCIFATALLFVCTSKANAQDPQNTAQQNHNQPRIEIGARFMPTFSSFQMQTSAGNMVKGSAVLGYGFEALLGYNFNTHIELQAEVIYSNISRKYTELDVERKVNLRYVNIPLLFSINSGKFKPVNLNIVLGPQVGIMVGSTIYTSGSTNTDTPQAVLSVRKSDLGFAYGAGLDFGINHSGTFRVGVGFRGVYGLIDISNNSPTSTNDSYYVLGRAHIQTYSIYSGLSFVF